MRQRVLTTTKILAVALVATSACTKPDVRGDPPAASASVPAVSASAASIASAGTFAVAMPAGSAVEDPKLVALREDLANTKRADALANVTRFRPLCDKDGYPLVGNLSRKSPDPGLQPSELCAEIRKKRS